MAKRMVKGIGWFVEIDNKHWRIVPKKLNVTFNGKSIRDNSRLLHGVVEPNLYTMERTHRFFKQHVDSELHEVINAMMEWNIIEIDGLNWTFLRNINHVELIPKIKAKSIFGIIRTDRINILTQAIANRREAHFDVVKPIVRSYQQLGENY